MLNRRKKSIRFRGHHTHGYGSKKKHRGSGHQGGVGMAGTGKKADQKKPSIWTDDQYFGRHGFTSQTKVLRSLNIFYIEEHFDSLMKDGKIKADGDAFTINLKDLKAEKILGSGEPTRKYNITAISASAKAVEKIKSLGGTVKVKPKVEKKSKKKE
jgi:large subunit ribosomal protein L15